jgi:DNA-directed RNA polymerase specialized sigma24 family protein
LTTGGSSTYIDDVESEATKLADATASKDPETGLAAVAALRRLLESLEQLQVENARMQGWSWERIAKSLGVSKQAVHQKYGGRGILRRRNR